MCNSKLQFIYNSVKINLNFNKMGLKFFILLNLYLGLLQFLSYSYVYGKGIDYPNINNDVDVDRNLDVDSMVNSTGKDDHVEIDWNNNVNIDKEVDTDNINNNINMENDIEIVSDDDIEYIKKDVNKRLKSKSDPILNDFNNYEEYINGNNNKYSSGKLLNQNQRNVTIEIPTYESDVSEPQFQFNLISPSPNETWTIGKIVLLKY